jgi:DNA-binding phage protein
VAKTHYPKSRQPARKELTVPHRDRLIDELRADPTLAVEYLKAAAEDGDARIYIAALRTVDRC